MNAARVRQREKEGKNPPSNGKPEKNSKKTKQLKKKRSSRKKNEEETRKLKKHKDKTNTKKKKHGRTHTHTHTMHRPAATPRTVLDAQTRARPSAHSPPSRHTATAAGPNPARGWLTHDEPHHPPTHSLTHSTGTRPTDPAPT